MVFVEPVSDSEEGTLRGRAFKLLKAGLAAIMLLTSVAADAAQLITEEEAKLPPPKGAIAADKRGNTPKGRLDAHGRPFW